MTPITVCPKSHQQDTEADIYSILGEIDYHCLIMLPISKHWTPNTSSKNCVAFFFSKLKLVKDCFFFFPKRTYRFTNTLLFICGRVSPYSTLWGICFGIQSTGGFVSACEAELVPVHFQAPDSYIASEHSHFSTRLWHDDRHEANSCSF